MLQQLSQLTVTVRDYDEALAFYVDRLGFERLEDTDQGGGKRWVRVRPPGSAAGILLAKAVGERQLASVGNQTGGRVFLFLETDDFWRDYSALVARGVTFVRPPSEEAYGTVAVFEDLYGNKFDLIGRRTTRLHPDAEELVKRLGLDPHPEGGFYRETWRSPQRVDGHPGGRRAASTAIYFLLPAVTFSAIHRVSSDEVWHHYDGDPVDLHLFDEDEPAHRVVRLGRDLPGGEALQCVVPAGVWQAAVPRGDRFALCGCTVAPGFEFADFDMPPRAELLARFPSHAELIARLTRADVRR
jgi:predicted cupin superfamily sugar epimerase/predicted enzyme related to lactoylglutathione lyase